MQAEMEWSDPQLRVKLVHPINTLDFVVCSLHLSPDYPSPTDTPLITALDRSPDTSYLQAQLDVITVRYLHRNICELFCTREIVFSTIYANHSNRLSGWHKRQPSKVHAPSIHWTTSRAIIPSCSWRCGHGLRGEIMHHNISCTLKWGI